KHRLGHARWPAPAEDLEGLPLWRWGDPHGENERELPSGNADGTGVVLQNVACTLREALPTGSQLGAIQPPDRPSIGSPRRRGESSAEFEKSIAPLVISNGPRSTALANRST